MLEIRLGRRRFLADALDRLQDQLAAAIEKAVKAEADRIFARAMPKKRRAPAKRRGRR